MHIRASRLFFFLFCRHLIENEVTPTKKNLKLVEIIQRKTNDPYQHFIDALRKTYNGHIVDILENTSITEKDRKAYRDNLPQHYLRSKLHELSVKDVKVNTYYQYIVHVFGI